MMSDMYGISITPFQGLPPFLTFARRTLPFVTVSSPFRAKVCTSYLLGGNLTDLLTPLMRVHRILLLRLESTGLVR